MRVCEHVCYRWRCKACGRVIRFPDPCGSCGNDGTRVPKGCLLVWEWRDCEGREPEKGMPA